MRPRDWALPESYRQSVSPTVKLMAGLAVHLRATRYSLACSSKADHFCGLPLVFSDAFPSRRQRAALIAAGGHNTFLPREPLATAAGEDQNVG